jgi:hypothetical protein
MKTIPSPMKTRLLTMAALFGASVLCSHAQSTVTFSAGPTQRGVVTVDDKPLAAGNYVSVGFFDPSLDLVAFANDLKALADAWNEYGSTTVQTVFGEPGRFAGSGSSMDPVFDDQQIFLWIFQTSNNSAPLTGFANVLGYGLYTSTAPNWIFPAQGSLPPLNTVSVNSSEVNEALFGGFDASSLVLQPIPEPSTWMLLLLSAGPLYLFARRRS